MGNKYEGKLSVDTCLSYSPFELPVHVCLGFRAEVRYGDVQTKHLLHAVARTSATKLGGPANVQTNWKCGDVCGPGIINFGGGDGPDVEPSLTSKPL